MQSHLTPKICSAALASAVALTLLFQSHAQADDPQTLADCEADYVQCFESAGFFGYFFCPQQYNQCAREVRSRLPAEVTQALDQVDNCQRINAVCRTAAEGDSEQLSYCWREQNVCIMDAFGIQPPPEGPKDALCIQDATRCLQASRTSDELGECGRSLQACLATPTQPL